MSDENWRELTSENDQLSKALSAANARIRELEAQRGEMAESIIQATEKAAHNYANVADDLMTMVGRDPTTARISSDCLRKHAVLLRAVADPAPARAEQSDQGGIDAA